MNENSQPSHGKISIHGSGMGAPTPELVEKRARELALIDERNPEEFTEADWDQAQRELSGQDTITAPEDVEEGSGDITSWDDMPGESGERAPRPGFEDDESLGEQLVSGGMEEAAHDQMVEARHEELKMEGGVIEGE